MSDSNTANCPICNEVLEAGQHACPRCGFKLIGETQTFSPVTGAGEARVEATDGAVPALEVVKGPYLGETFTLGEGSYTMGREPTCDIFLSNMTVSRHHATISVRDGAARIVDENSLNGTWVDGKVVDEAPLYPGTRVQIGTFDMIFKHLSR